MDVEGIDRQCVWLNITQNKHSPRMLVPNKICLSDERVTVIVYKGDVIEKNVSIVGGMSQVCGVLSHYLRMIMLVGASKRSIRTKFVLMAVYLI